MKDYDDEVYTVILCIHISSMVEHTTHMNTS